MKPSENNKNPFRICVFHTKGLLPALILWLAFFQVNAQTLCDGSVPQLTANLSSSPTASWISASVVRNGECCSASNPDRCLQFNVTLHPDAAGIIFNIASGAVPPGALYYQINCGTPTQVGSAICLSGAGPHILTFCKPGNNSNQYSITSVPKASVVDTVRTSYFCTKKIGTRGFITSTLTWRSVFPGTSGQYNNALNCTNSCDTAIFTAAKGLPQEIRYEVCGMMQSGCITTSVCDTVTVLIAPELTANITPSSPIICFGDSGVQLNVLLSGGVPPYQVLWSNGSTKLNTFATSAGKYAVRVTDSTGCVIVSDSVNVIANPKLNANAGRDTSICKGSRFVVGGTPTASGGSSPYTYQWAAIGDTLSNTAIANPQASPYLNSTYFLTVTDNNGCKAYETMRIVVGTCNVVCNGATGPNILGAMGTFSEPYIVPNNTTSALCIRNGTPQAPLNNIGMPKPNQTTYVYAQTSGGLGPEGRYTFVKTLGDGATANCLHNDFRGRDRTGDGGYFMAINGSPNQSLFGGTFFKLDSIPVCPNTDYEFSAWLSNLKTGMQSHPANSFPNVAFFINNVIVAFSGPVGPTTGQWFNNWTKAGGTWNSGSEPYANIRIDNYTFVASGNDLALDDIHFKVCGPVIVSQTSRTLYCEGDEVIIRDSVACTNGQLYSWYRWQQSLDGGATWTNVSGVQSSNNNAFYPVTLGPFTATASLNNSMYRLMVALDSTSLALANPNCIILGNATTIKVGTPPMVQMNVADTICPGIETVLAPVISGGTTPYYIEWKNLQTATTSNQQTYQFTISQPTSIVLNVSDTAGCVATDTMHFEPAPILNFNKSVQHVLCYGTNSGSISIQLNNLAAPYTFAWNDGNTSNPRSALAANSYTVTITDRFGCSVSDNTVINQPTEITVTESINHVGCASDNSGAIQLSVSGGNTPHSFAWSNGGNSNNISNLNGGNYAVTINDLFGCSVVRNYTVNESDSLTASLMVTNVHCFGAANGMATVNVGGGTPPYQFIWSNGSATNSIQNVAAGSYVVTITDFHGCSKVRSAIITSPDAIQLTINKTDANCFAQPGKAKASITGGTAPFTFAWSNGGSVDSISNVPAGNYSVTVTDFNGCSAVANTSIIQPDSISTSGIAVTNVLCFGNNIGSIVINSVSGGTAPYTYAWSNGASTQNISNLVAGTYILTITDSRGCSAVRSFAITQPNTVLAATGTPQNITCFNQNNGSIQLSVSGGTSSYTFTWSNGSTQQNQSNLAAGSYSVTVRDANNCSVVQSFVITQPNQLAATINKTDANCFGETGKAKAIVAGGTAPFTFTWSNGSSLDSISNVIAGNYSVTVSDFNGCSATQNVSITQPDSVSLSGIVVTNVLCFGNNTGNVSIGSVAGGTAPYTYAWSNGASTQNISNLVAGNYSLTITDSRGCSATRSFVITQPNAALSVSGVSTNVSCFNQSNGSIQLTVNGGTPGYTFTWSNAASSQNLNNLAAANYAVTVRDANNCSVAQSFVITQPNQLATSINKTDANCFGETGKAKAIVAGGTAPFTFAWSNGSSLDSISNVGAGNYSVTVSDFNGCSVVANTTITQPDSVSLSGIVVTNVLCFGNNTGSISIGNVSGGTPSYTYTWSNGATTKNISNLVAGNYSLTITDSRGCSAVRSFAITQPYAALSVSGTTKNLTCHNIADGAVQLNVMGGVMPYIYTWSNGSASKHQSGIAAGNYRVTVTDANGCVATDSFNITQPDSLSINATVAHVLCHGNATGSIQLNVNGATAPYTYQWSNGSLAAQIQNLVAGSFAVTVADSRNCTAVRNYAVAQPLAGLSVSAIVTNASCNNVANGSIQLNATGGTSPYSFAWNNGSTSANATQLAAGSYQATVTDANSCSTTYSATITQPDSLKLQANITNASCNGANSGSIDLQPIGGTAPYIYNWSNGQVSQDIHQLAAGNYFVQVADAKGCYATGNFAVTQPQPLALVGNPTVQHVQCNNANTGSIQLQLQGGTTPYVYQWSSGQNTASINNIPAGSYSLTVTDAQQCTLVLSQQITQPAAVQVSMFKTDETCKNKQDGTAQATASGGTPPYRYFWNNGGANAGIANLSSGTYTVTVADANSCSVVNAIAIQSPDSIKVTSSIKPISCHGKSDGEITIQISGGTSPYQHQWSTGASASQIKNLVAGVYSAVVTDANGCSASGSFTVKQPDPIQLALSKTDITCNSKNNGTINLNVNGGIPPYAYLWSNNETTTTINNLSTGNYTVTVSDASQCSKADSAAIHEPSPIIVTANIENAKCFGEASGNVFTNASGGVSPYNYVWNSGATQKDLLNVAAANYQLTVTDNNGCTRIAQATVAQPQPIQIQFAVQHNKCFGASDGEVTANVTGGNLPYQYAWSNGSTAPSIKQIISGDYVLDIKDVLGCTATNVAKVNQPDEVKASITTKGVSCMNQNSGTATVAAIGGNPPYQYLWMNGAKTNVINGLAVNTVVSVTVKDANGCETFVQDTIKEIPAMNLDAMVQHLTCKQNSLGSISLVVENGVSPYQYAWSSGQKTSSIAVSSAGSFSVTVTDRNGCTVSANYTITADTGFTINTINAQTIKLGEIVELTTTATSTDIRSWMWTPANFDAGMNCSNCQSPDAQPKKTTTYLVKALDNKGCEATDTVTITVTTDHTIFIPNMFSPNGDGVNDVFEIYGNYDGIKEFDFKIFNRWGEKVFESSDPRARWDGTYKNVMQDPGVFVYYMKVLFLDGWKPDDDGKGSFTLVR